MAMHSILPSGSHCRILRRSTFVRQHNRTWLGSYYSKPDHQFHFPLSLEYNVLAFHSRLRRVLLHTSFHQCHTLHQWPEGKLSGIQRPQERRNLPWGNRCRALLGRSLQSHRTSLGRYSNNQFHHLQSYHFYLGSNSVASHTPRHRVLPNKTALSQLHSGHACSGQPLANMANGKISNTDSIMMLVS